MDRIRAILLWCAGAVEPRRLDGLETERTRYVSLGLCLLVPACLAWVGGTLAAGLLFTALPARLLGGALWAAIVFIIDRALVVSLRQVPRLPDETRLSEAGELHRWAAWRSGTLIVGRLALALVVGVVVSHTLVLRLFGPEIEEQLDLELLVTRVDRLAPIDARLTGLAVAENERRTSLDRLRQKRRDLELERVRENAGVGLSGRYGQGQVWTDLQNAIDALDQDLSQAEASARDARAEADREVARLRRQRDTETERLADSQARGYMAHARALEAVAAASPELRAARRVLFTFLVMLELVPLLVKLLVGRGPYGAVLAADEWQARETARVAVEAVARTRSERVRHLSLDLPWMRTGTDRESAC